MVSEMYSCTENCFVCVVLCLACKSTRYDRRLHARRVGVVVDVCVEGGVSHKLRGKDELSQNSELRT